MLPLLTVLLLGSPIACPPDVGQIKWSGLEYSFKAKGARYVIEGTLWDRDRNGRPSKNDLMKVESATVGGNAMAVDEAWVTVRGKLAKGLAKTFARSPGLVATCESRFKVEGVPRVSTGKALAKMLRGNSGYREISPAEQAQADMGGWAAEICKGDDDISQRDLANRLATRARHAHRSVRKRRLKQIARHVAKAWSRECSHLDVPKKLTFE